MIRTICLGQGRLEASIGSPTDAGGPLLDSQHALLRVLQRDRLEIETSAVKRNAWGEKMVLPATVGSQWRPRNRGPAVKALFWRGV